MYKNKNILLADFLGWNRHETYNFLTDHYQDYLSIGAGICQTPIFREEDLRFHKSWDWLMPVVAEIASKGMYFLTYDDDKASFHKQYDRKIRCVTTGNLLGAYETVVEFIEWYNKQKLKK